MLYSHLLQTNPPLHTHTHTPFLRFSGGQFRSPSSCSLAPPGAKLIQMTLISESVNGSVSQPLTVICHHFCRQNGSILHRDKKKVKSPNNCFHHQVTSHSSCSLYISVQRMIYTDCSATDGIPHEGINPYKH